MTLAQFLAGEMPDTETLRSLALVFDGEVAQEIRDADAAHGDPRCRLVPAATADGRWLCSAEILPDCITPGATYFPVFSTLGSDVLSAIDVIPLSSVPLPPPKT